MQKGASSPARGGGDPWKGWRGRLSAWRKSQPDPLIPATRRAARSSQWRDPDRMARGRLRVGADVEAVVASGHAVGMKAAVRSDRMMRRSQLVGITVALWVALGASSASAAGGNPDNWCRNGFFPAEEAIGVARVSANAKVRLVNDFYADCPGKASHCLGKAYVVPGDTVLMGHTYGDYICTFFPNRVGGSAGWIETKNLARVPTQSVAPLDAWAGTWRNGDDRIRISVTGRTLTAEGEAFWPAEYPDPKLVPGGPHDGQMGGTAQPNGNVAKFEQDGCQVKLRLIGAYLAATDNRECGGLNVRFDGIYRRK